MTDRTPFPTVGGSYRVVNGKLAPDTGKPATPAAKPASPKPATTGRAEKSED